MLANRSVPEFSPLNMPQVRRSSDRRRRVLYQSQAAPPPASTPALRREIEKLREARQPARPFGSRVHQPLRGRWFSLVPVSSAGMIAVAASLLGIGALLSLGHHLAVTWPALAFRPSVARPLRIDRPDSFATWWLAMVLLASAGVALLIYQLRRHRSDDYRGHYRLWRLTLVVLLLASINSVVGLIAWTGGFLDWVFGDRAVLSGENWLRLLVDVGGIILTMRLVAEVYRCRTALIPMLASAGLLGFAEAASWNLIAVDSVLKATLVLSAPMLGLTCLLVATIAYLRSLYRQVRNIADAPPLRERLSLWIDGIRDRDATFRVVGAESESDEEAADEADWTDPDDESSDTAETRSKSRGGKTEDSADKSGKRRRWWSLPFGRRSERPDREAAAADSDSQENDSRTAEPSTGPSRRTPLRDRLQRRSTESSPSREAAGPGQDEPGKDTRGKTDSGEKPKRGRRRWFGLRRAKPDAADGGTAKSEGAAKPKREQPAAKAEKKRRFSLRLRPQASPADDSGQDGSGSTPGQAASSQSDEANASGQPDSAAKKGLFSRLLSRRSKSDVSKSPSKPKRNAGNSDQTGKRHSPPERPAAGSDASSRGGDDDDFEDDSLLDPDQIDWSSMSKSERRRMRKRLKRSGQAA
ncbi:hypothetical protein [Roseiconus nitratireducens]|uniref:hypothetical protein n=1 Tax=Roseiconus nitratireducens TaxID=2605748 RepID=UPI001376228F|nr:hypothetical protein [Roseiconus nitratireducens]